MLTFESDYTTGAHPEILKRLTETNLEQVSGYGKDRFTESAVKKMREACGCPEAQIYLTAGGTQANQLVISTMLKGYEGVVAAETGHVSLHEAGAIEYSGHKVLTVPGHMGKMLASELKQYLESFYKDDNHPQMVFPGMVYISQPTEYGSLYRKKELEDISGVCREYGIPLFVDGARLGYALAAHEADVDLADMADLADIFYIGGTKVGALVGEAILYTHGNMPEHFVTMAKQRGALLAKGRLLGLQFDTLFTDNLYLECGKNAIIKKDRLVKILKNAGFEFFYESPTNQQFVIMDRERFESLKEKVGMGFWETHGETQCVVRFATSWSTSDEDLDELEKILSEN